MGFGVQASFNKQEEGSPEVNQNQNAEPKQDVKAEPKQEQPQQQKEVEPPKQDVKTNAKPQQEEPKQEKAVELDKEQVEAYLKSNYFKDKDFEGLDALLQPREAEVKEVEKIVNPWEDVIDESEEAYLKFKRDTGLGRKEWDFVQKDVGEMSLMELAEQKVKQDTGLNNLSKAEVQEYLESKLNVDLTDEELTSTDKIELNRFVKSYKEDLLDQQKKYLQPLDEETRAKRQNKSNPNLLTLPDGRQVTKEDYQKEIEIVRNEYLDNIKKGVSSAAPSEFDIEINDNGDKRNYKFKYEFSEKDKQSMLSDGSDIDAMLEKRYKTEDGFDHSRLVKGLWWGDEQNQKKVISAAMQQARAEVIAELSQSDNNENFNRKPLQTQPNKQKGYGSLTDGIAGQKRGFGVKVNI